MPEEFFRLYYYKKDSEKARKILRLFKLRNPTLSSCIEGPLKDDKDYFMIQFQIREKLVDFLKNQQKTYKNSPYSLEIDTNYNGSLRNILLNWIRR